MDCLQNSKKSVRASLFPMMRSIAQSIRTSSIISFIRLFKVSFSSSEKDFLVLRPLEDHMNVEAVTKVEFFS